MTDTQDLSSLLEEARALFALLRSDFSEIGDRSIPESQRASALEHISWVAGELERIRFSLDHVDLGAPASVEPARQTSADAEAPSSLGISDRIDFAARKVHGGDIHGRTGVHPPAKDGD